jgi:6-phosphogluconolactonase
MIGKKSVLDYRIIMIVISVVISPSIFISVDQSYPEETMVYVSNGEDGNISIWKLNPDTGELELLTKVPAGQKVMHMAVSPDHRLLYASIRSEPYSAITYLINPQTGILTQMAKVSLPANMVYISVDKTGRFLLSTSYNEAMIAVNPISPNGTAQPNPVQIISTGEKPHSIRSDLSNRFVYVPHLGTSQIKQFLFNEKNGTLTPNEPDAVNTRDNSGPRHIEFSPDNRFVYVSNEIDGTVYSYELNNETGILTEIQRISAMPRDLNPQLTTVDNTTETDDLKPTNLGVADIHITPNGKWLYVSERDSSTVAAFAVDTQSGSLTHIENYDTEKIPRGIDIDPRGNFLVVAGQESGYLSVYQINNQSGQLMYLNRYESGQGPNWIEIVELE